MSLGQRIWKTEEKLRAALVIKSEQFHSLKEAVCRLPRPHNPRVTINP